MVFLHWLLFFSALILRMSISFTLSRAETDILLLSCTKPAMQIAFLYLYWGITVKRQNVGINDIIM